MTRPGEETGKKCICPYCDAEVDEEAIFCVACKTAMIECAGCGKPVREGVTKCPHCGGSPS